MAHKKKKKKIIIYKIRPGELSEAYTPPVTTPGIPSQCFWKLVNDLINNQYYIDEDDLKKDIDDIKPASEYGKLYKKLKDKTGSYNRKALSKHYDKITRVGTTGRRKQKFKISKVPELIPLIKDRRKINDIESFDLDDGFKVTGLVIKGKRQPLTGLGLYSYMERNKINHVVDIIKAWPKDKSLKVPSWKVLMVYLKSLNFTPEEVLDGAIMSSQTKKRFIEKRIFREYENNAEYAVNNLIEIYRNFLKTKQPFKMFLADKKFVLWCQEEDINFESDNHCRDTVKQAVKLYNKKNPKDKIPEKMK
jgi:hypothetical protein